MIEPRPSQSLATTLPTELHTEDGYRTYKTRSIIHHTLSGLISNMKRTKNVNVVKKIVTMTAEVNRNIGYYGQLVENPLCHKHPQNSLS